ncbi:response regulator transcription factor [Streptomyces sp. JJ36]|uniref:response regulator transcription factor n=1 Tax=Streptomyces sp. JJ36 TaxID=2736645 RepID=UPI001F36583F|nr:response regulator transcription factor [Streptomyces sp. JJ36]
MHPHEMVRCGLEAMLTDIVEEVVVLADARHARHRLAAEHFDVLVCRCAATEEVLGLVPVCRDRRTKMVALLDSAEEQQFALASEVPADGFLLAGDLTARSLDDTLRRLGRGEMPLPAALSRWLLGRMREGPASSAGRSERPYCLTPREQEALNLLAQGLSNKQIARTLGISQHGAKRHVANVIAKLNCPNRTLAVALALREGLVDAPGTDPAGAEARPAGAGRRQEPASTGLSG